MADNLREYVVTLYRHEDLDSFYEDMETPGGNLYIPDRRIDVAMRRAISRNTNYWLTPEEAEELKKDPRIWDVALTGKESGIIVGPDGWYETDHFYSKELDIRQLSLTSNHKYRNWGLLRIANDPKDSNWGWNGTTIKTGSVSSALEGRDVDIVVTDNGIIADHPEFAVNSDGTGGSRVQQIDWYQYTSAAGYSGNFPTSGYKYTYDQTNTHGTMCAGVIAGNTQGWARKANIYDLIAYGSSNQNALSSTTVFDYIRAWHKSKPSGNPTIVNASWGSRRDTTLSNIQSISHRGTVYNGPFTSDIFANFGIYVRSGDRIQVPIYAVEYIADVEDLINDGIVFVAAAGNSYMKGTLPGEEDYNNTITFTDTFGNFLQNIFYHRGSTPGAVAGTISVGSTRSGTSQQRADYSTHGRVVNIWAPGTSILTPGSQSSGAYILGLQDPRSSKSEHQLCIQDGTSFAAPQVAGVLALHAELLRNIDQTKAFELLNTFKSADVPEVDAFEGYDSLSNLQDAIPTHLGFKNPTFNLLITTSNPTNNKVFTGGDTVTYTITTTNVPDGSQLYLQWSAPNFFVDNTTFTYVTINNNSASITRQTLSKLPGTGPYSATLRSGTNGENFLAFDNGDITIVAPSPTYTVVNNSAVIEGSDISFTVITTNVPDGTRLYYSLGYNDPNTTETDFTSASGSFTINGGVGTFDISIVEDFLTEGTQSFYVDIRTDSTSGTIVTTSFNIEIIDTSITPVIPTYSLSPSSLSVNEGDTITVTVNTTDIPNNTVLYWKAYGLETADSSDVNPSTGSVTINNNTGSFSFDIVSDLLTEGLENTICTLHTGSINGSTVATSDIIQINDTSKTIPTYSISPATNNVNEGSSLTFNITTTEVSDGTTLYWSVSDTSQFAVSSGSVVINNNTANFTVTPKEDRITEGNTTFNAILSTDDQAGITLAISNNVTINDTSISPSYVILTNNSNNDSSDVFPEDIITYTILTSNVPNGTVLYITNSSETEASSFVDGLTETTVTIQNNNAVFQRTIVTNIFSQKSAKIELRLDNYSGDIVAVSDLLNILPDPASYSVTANKTSVDEGDSVAFTIQGNVQDGTVLYWKILGNYDSQDFDNPIQGTVTLNSGVGNLILNIDEDLEIESGESFYLEIRINSYSGDIVATSDSIAINDTSIIPAGPTYTLSQSSLSIREGETLTITLDTTELSDQSLVRWIISGTNIDSGDFVGIPSLEGNFNIINNTSELDLTLRSDLKTEGTEYFILTLPDVPGTPGISVTINDTSLTPLPAVLPKFYVNASSPTIDEGTYIFFNIRATDLESNVTIGWNLQGIPTEGILGGVNSGTVLLEEKTEGEWTGTVQIGILEDFRTTGVRTAFLTISPGFPYVLEVSQSVIVRDTSLDIDPRYSLALNKTRVIEGGNVTVTVFATNVPDNTIVPLSILPWEGSDINEGDFVGIANLKELYFPPLKNNTASFTANTLDDFKFEQTEFFYFFVPGSVVATSQPIELIDSGNTLVTSNATFTGNVEISFLDKARIAPEIGGLSIGEGFWEDSSGKLSDSIFVQGKLPFAAENSAAFYQPFSYVIRSNKSIELWKDSIKRVLHPAGLALFSEIDSETLPGEEFNVEPSASDNAVIRDFFALTADNSRLPFCASNVVYTNTRFSIPLKSDFAYYIHREL